MIPRYLIAIVLASVVTFGLFFLMQRLIAQADGRPSDRAKNPSIEFVRLKQDQELQTKDRKIPDKDPAEQPPPPPPLSTSQNDRPDSEASGFADTFDLAADLGGPSVSGGVGAVDTDIIPLLRVDPTYPIRAQERGIEGWVEVEFTISAGGTVADCESIAFVAASGWLAREQESRPNTRGRAK